VFFQSSSVHCCCSFTHCNCRFLFFCAERSGTLHIRRVPHPIRVKVWWVEHYFTGLLAPMLHCTVSWLTPARLLLCTICVSLLWPLINEPFSTTGLPLVGCPLGGGPFLIHTGKLLSVKNPAVLLFLTHSNRCTSHLPYPVQRQLNLLTFPFTLWMSHAHNPCLKA